jgi:hypothetical protein
VPTTETNAASGGWDSARHPVPSFSFPADRLPIASPAPPEQERPSHAHGQPPHHVTLALSFSYVRFSLSSSPRRSPFPAHLARPLGFSIQKPPALCRSFLHSFCFSSVAARLSRAIFKPMHGRGDRWKYSPTRQVTKTNSGLLRAKIRLARVAFCTLLSS